jgi:hypothetical protein
MTDILKKPEVKDLGWPPSKVSNAHYRHRAETALSVVADYLRSDADSRAGAIMAALDAAGAEK